MSDTKLKTVLVDGLPIDCTDAAAIVINTLQGRVTAAQTALSDANTSHAAVIAAKDKELGTQAAEIVTLKAGALDDAKLDALVTSRADVIAKAKIVDAKVVTAGISLPAIRRAAVLARLGDAGVKDKSDDYVEALFDGFAAQGERKDPLADAARHALGDRKEGAGTLKEQAEAAVAARNKSLSDGWKTSVAA